MLISFWTRLMESRSRSRTSKGGACPLTCLSTLSAPVAVVVAATRHCCWRSRRQAGICGVATPADGHVGRTPRASCLSALPARQVQRGTRCLFAWRGDSLPHWPPHTSLRRQSWASRRVRRFECVRRFFIPVSDRGAQKSFCQCVGRQADAAPWLSGACAVYCVDG